MQNFNTTDTPLVSFIITCKDLPSEQVAECVNSILQLSLRTDEREIILVDAASGKCMLNEISDISSHIIYIRLNSGSIENARNAGLRFAQGRYIQFIDGEDKLFTEAYEHCIDIARYNSPDIVIFNSDASETGQNDYSGEKPTEGSEYMKHNNLTASPWGYIFAKRLLINLKFETDTFDADEEFTTLLFLRAEKIYSSSAVAYFDRNKKKEKVERSDKRCIIKRLDDAFAIICRLQQLADTMPPTDKAALQRRCAQLTMNYIINTIRWTRSAKQLSERIEKLKEAGLFPLPDRNYSKKYILFNKLSRSSIMMKIICKMLG